jgi:hypothetical protein
MDAFPEEILAAILDFSLDSKTNYFMQALVCKKWYEIVVEIWERRMNKSTENFVSELHDDEIEELMKSLRCAKSFYREKLSLIMHLCGDYPQPDELLYKQMEANAMNYVLHQCSEYENFIHKFLTGMHMSANPYLLDMYKKIKQKCRLNVYYNKDGQIEYFCTGDSLRTNLDKNNFHQFCAILGAKPISYKDFKTIMHYIAKSRNFKVTKETEEIN